MFLRVSLGVLLTGGLLAAALAGGRPLLADGSSAAAQPSPSVVPVAPKVSFGEPGVSPDGREIAFVSGGDIWTVAASGGEARLLVSHPATESRPLFAPDGKAIAFASTRTGNGDLYVLTLETGDVRRLTYDDNADVPTGWSPDGRWLYFASTSQDLGNMGDLFRIAVEGGTPMPVVNDPYFNEFFGAAAPDGQRLAYSARGIANGQWWRRGHSHLDESEVWITTVSGTPAGGAAAAYQQVTSGGAKALWPMWSADGRTIFFVSDRSGTENIWRVAAPAPGAAATATAAKDDAKAITTFGQGRVLWPTITGDGKTIAFERDFAVWTLDTTSGRAQPLAITRRGAPAGTGTEHQRLTNGLDDLALSPDGKKVAFAARGDLFAASAKDGGDAFRVSATPAVDTTPIWTPDSRRLVYLAETLPTSELHVYDFGTNASTRLTAGQRDYAPALAPNGEQIAFVRNGTELCVATLPAAPAPSTGTTPASAATGAASASASSTPASATAATSSATGSSAAANTGTAAPAARNAKVASSTGTPRCLAKGALPSSTDGDGAIAWSPDSRWIAYLASGAKSFANVQVIAASGGEPKPVSFLANVYADTVRWSPDGTFLLFATGQRTESSQVARVDLVLRTPKFREDQFRDLFPAQPATPDRPSIEPAKPSPATSPAPSSAPASPVSPEKPAETTPADTKPPDAKAGDAKSGEKPPAPPKPTEIVFEDIRARLGYLPVGVDVNTLAISPDGKTLLLTAASAGQTNLYAWSLDELARERPVARQLTSTPGAKSDAQFSPDSKEVYYLEEGRIQIVALDRREPRPLAVTAELDVDFTIERDTVFAQAWAMLNEYFYDSAFHGVAWSEMRQRYAPYAAGAATGDELRRITSLMIGELNASHTGISAPPNPASATGRLGLRFDRDEHVRSGRLKITDVVPLGPAAVTRAIAVGDVLVAVNGTPIVRTANLDRLLEHTIGKRVTLTIESGAGAAVPAGADAPSGAKSASTPATAAGARREVAVQPVNLSTERGLVYRQWVEGRRAYVSKASGGRLGYVHMPDMGAAALTQLYVDLDAENHARDGVVIDLRNNNGGFVNAYALDVFARRPYLNMTMRGRPTAPARTVLGQRALESPTILVTNQHSLSDAEDFTEGYRRLKLGKVVGEPTAGWIIYTGGARLIDGSALRLPRIRITDEDGKNMELAPRPVDIAITRQPGEMAAGRDVQLDAAVKALLAQIDSGGTARKPPTQAAR